MATCIKIALVFLICFVVAGCGDSYSDSGRGSAQRHYSELIGQRGQARQMHRDGHGGGTISYSPWPIYDVINSPPDSGLRRDTYRVNSQGNIYP